MRTLLEDLLARRTKQRVTAPGRVSSAVLIPLYRDRDTYYIVFIRRSNLVSAHKGQISFPGGSQEPEDADLKETALRESFEEIGLKPADADVIGELDDEVTTTSNFLVTPFVAMIPWPYTFVREKFEVDEILSIPLSALLDTAILQQCTETLDGAEIPSYTFDYHGTTIWGATARILYKFLDLIRPALKCRA